jgi:hypothetical protein
MTVKTVVFGDMTPRNLVDRDKLFFVFRIENNHFEKRVLSIGVTCGAARRTNAPPPQYF